MLSLTQKPDGWEALIAVPQLAEVAVDFHEKYAQLKRGCPASIDRQIADAFVSVLVNL